MLLLTKQAIYITLRNGRTDYSLTPPRPISLRPSTYVPACLIAWLRGFTASAAVGSVLIRANLVLNTRSKEL